MDKEEILYISVVIGFFVLVTGCFFAFWGGIIYTLFWCVKNFILL
jgi:hypothetical protein